MTSRRCCSSSPPPGAEEELDEDEPQPASASASSGATRRAGGNLQWVVMGSALVRIEALRRDGSSWLRPGRRSLLRRDRARLRTLKRERRGAHHPDRRGYLQRHLEPISDRRYVHVKILRAVNIL